MAIDLAGDRAREMAGDGDLSGHRILVVEDDYYLAVDSAHAIRGAGADVLGPCATAEAARGELAEAGATGAVLDLNLGEGAPSFALAAELRARGVPFIIVTGYDDEIIPSEYDTVPRLQKPVHLRQMVGVLAAALDAGRGQGAKAAEG